MAKNERKNYANQLKKSVKELLEDIDSIADLEMIYGMSKAAYTGKPSQKGRD